MGYLARYKKRGLGVVQSRQFDERCVTCQNLNQFFSHTKTETALEGGLDPTGEAIGAAEGMLARAP